MKAKTVEEVATAKEVLDIDIVVHSKKIIEIKKAIESAIKRLVDIIFGIVGVICLVPLIAIIYVARKMMKEDDGPIFYEQLRIGKNGKTFRLYKFRTMVVGADEKLKTYLDENEEARKEYEETHKLKNDPRITKIGKILRKTSLDETPQLINVLKGNMSLIGPRPYLLREKEDMGMYYDKIIRCKPGITGLWQTSGRSKTTFEERLEIESSYVDNNSLKIDAQILLKTIGTVFKREGAI